MSARIRWTDWLPLGLFLVLTAWLLGAAMLASAGGRESVSAAGPESTAVPVVLLPAPAPSSVVGPGASVATGSDPATAPAATAPATAPAATALVSTDWAEATAQATGIPYRALLGYAGAALRLASEQPGCRLGWTTLAALGSIESGHGSHDGSVLDADGRATPGIFGPLLDGTVYDAFPDTDAGRWDDNTDWDRAVGPLQFIPATWSEWGADGNGDSLADPQQIDDAALTTGRYLCHAGDLSVAADWRAAVYSYNHVDSYVDSVAATANGYAARMP